MVFNAILHGLGILVAALALLYGCALPWAIQREEIRGVGYFEFREAASGMEGIVVAAPHGKNDRDSARLVQSISDRTGAGLAIAYGFRSKRIPVSQPIVRTGAYPTSSKTRQRGSVFREYREILRRAAKGEVDLYIGVRKSGADTAGRIEVATSGLTFEEAMALKAAYMGIRDRLVPAKGTPKLEMAIEPLERISWHDSGVKHHGVLLIAEKGLDIRLPPMLSLGLNGQVYAEILSRWVHQTVVVLRENPSGLPQMRVKLADLGRFELLDAKEAFSGIVIGSPHGSYDEFTAEMVKRLSYRTGFAAVIAKGFTPTETGATRINVNRPTEKIPYSEGRELRSQRALETYRAFRDLVFEVSRGALDLYVDVHQYNTDSYIQVATVGLSRKEAEGVKKIYRAIRDRTLRQRSRVPTVDLLIEPLDTIEIGAWAAKSEGILGLAKKSLHFELPSQRVFLSNDARDAYTRILAGLLREAARLLVHKAEGPTE